MPLQGSGDDALARRHGRAPISTLTHLALAAPLTWHPATARQLWWRGTFFDQWSFSLSGAAGLHSVSLITFFQTNWIPKQTLHVFNRKQTNKNVKIRNVKVMKAKKASESLYRLNKEFSSCVILAFDISLPPLLARLRRLINFSLLLSLKSRSTRAGSLEACQSLFWDSKQC